MLCIGKMEPFQPVATAARNGHKQPAAHLHTNSSISRQEWPFHLPRGTFTVGGIELQKLTKIVC
jgi:hypothetical protein